MKKKAKKCQEGATTPKSPNQKTLPKNMKCGGKKKKGK